LVLHVDNDEQNFVPSRSDYPVRFPKALLGPERISVHGGTLEDLHQSVALLTNMAKLNLLLSELRVQLVVLCAEAPA
jgi:hypothetical protein